jgi:hypothetical protein
LISKNVFSKIALISGLSVVCLTFTNCSNYQEQLVSETPSIEGPEDFDFENRGNLSLSLNCPSNPDLAPPNSAAPQALISIGGLCEVLGRPRTDYRLRIQILPGGFSMETTCDLGRFFATLPIAGLALDSYSLQVTLSALVGGQETNSPPPQTLACPFDLR